MAKNTNFLDTNCLLRYVLGDNEERGRKVEALIGKGVQVDSAAFLEFVWVLQAFYKMNRQQVYDRLKIIIDDKRVFCARQLLDQVAELYTSIRQVSFLDIYLALKAEQEGGFLRTFDQPLIKKLPKQTQPIS